MLNRRIGLKLAIVGTSSGVYMATIRPCTSHGWFHNQVPFNDDPKVLLGVMMS